MYRTTALIDAPRPVVAAALTTAATVGAALAAGGFPVRSGAELLIPGEHLVTRGVPRRVRVVDTRADRVAVVLLGARPRWLVGHLAQTPAGTLLTAIVDGPVGRRRALAMVETLASCATAEALRLREARTVVATALVRGREVLVQQRDFPPDTAGRWELPGGRVEPGESDVDAVRRECAEELGVPVRPGTAFGPAVPVAGGTLLLRGYLAAVVDGEPVPREHRAVRWVPAGRLGDLDWLPADRVLLPSLRAALDRSADAGHP